MLSKIEKRQRRQRRIRVKMFGTPERPRMAVVRSLSNTFVQIIDDSAGKTLVSASTLDKDVKSAHKYGGNVKSAHKLGEVIAQKAKEKGISKIIFDRRGSAYHGRIKAVAEAARKSGLEF